MREARKVLVLAVVVIVALALVRGGDARNDARYALLAMASVRLIGDARAVAAAKLPIGRLLLPILGVGLIIAIGNGALPRAAALVIVAAVETVALLLVVTVFRSGSSRVDGDREPEDILYERLLSVFPPPLARIAAMELTLLRSAPMAPVLFFRGSTGEATSYVESAKIAWLVLLIPVTLVPDIFLIELLVPAYLVWLKVVLAGLGVYSVLWVWGTYTTMVRRRHDLSERRLVFHNGLMGRAVVDPSSVLEVEVLPPRRGILQFAKDAYEANFAVGGVGSVRLFLHEPAVVRQLLLKTNNEVLRLVIPSDRPDQLASEILRYSSATGLVTHIADPR